MARASCRACYLLYLAALHGAVAKSGCSDHGVPLLTVNETYGEPRPLQPGSGGGGGDRPWVPLLGGWVLLRRAFPYERTPLTFWMRLYLLRQKGFPERAGRIPCYRAQGIHLHVPDITPPFRRSRRSPTCISRDLPCFAADNREITGETGSPETASTTTESSAPRRLWRRWESAQIPPSGVTTSFRPPRFLNVIGTCAVTVCPSADTDTRLFPQPFCRSLPPARGLTATLSSPTSTRSTSNCTIRASLAGKSSSQASWSSASRESS